MAAGRWLWLRGFELLEPCQRDARPVSAAVRSVRRRSAKDKRLCLFVSLHGKVIGAPHSRPGTSHVSAHLSNQHLGIHEVWRGRSDANRCAMCVSPHSVCPGGRANRSRKRCATLRVHSTPAVASASPSPSPPSTCPAHTTCTTLPPSSSTATVRASASASNRMCATPCIYSIGSVFCGVACPCSPLFVCSHSSGPR